MAGGPRGQRAPGPKRVAPRERAGILAAVSSRADAPRILLAATGLTIDGGIASVSRCMARAFDELCLAGRAEGADRVLLHDRPDRSPAPPARGGQHMASGSQGRFTWALWRQLARHRHELTVFDIVGLARTARLPLPGLRPRRYAVFVHGLELTRAASKGRADALRGAWRILVNSAFTGEWLLRDFPELRDRVRVVVLCIDPERVAAWQAAGADTPPDASERQPAVLIVGRMKAVERGKGHDALLEAWPAVRRRVPEAALWVAGDGDDRARLEARSEALGLGASVRFLGRIPDEELMRRYRTASVFAMPSRQEGFGLVYAEAMWHGLPCVGSTADAAAQVVEDGRTGLLVPYGEPEPLAAALAKLLEDPDLRATMARASRARARTQFAYPRFRDDLLAALELPALA